MNRRASGFLITFASLLCVGCTEGYSVGVLGGQGEKRTFLLPGLCEEEAKQCYSASEGGGPRYASFECHTFLIGSARYSESELKTACKK